MIYELYYVLMIYNGILNRPLQFSEKDAIDWRKASCFLNRKGLNPWDTLPPLRTECVGDVHLPMLLGVGFDPNPMTAQHPYQLSEPKDWTWKNNSRISREDRINTKQPKNHGKITKNHKRSIHIMILKGSWWFPSLLVIVYLKEHPATTMGFLSPTPAGCWFCLTFSYFH